MASFAIIASSFSSELAPSMCLAQIVNWLGLAPGSTVHPSKPVPISRRLAYGGDSALVHQPEDLVRHRGLSVNNTGADVRISTGEIMEGKSAAHASVRAWWWQWRHLLRIFLRVVLAGKTAQARRQQRAGIRLKDYTVTPKTKARYESAVSRILPFLDRPSLT